jgi:hypothetical protein
VRIAKRDMAENLKRSQKKAKGSMSKTRRLYRCGKREPSTKCPSPRAITTQEALTLLESAVSYCEAAGLKVQAANGDNGTLGLFIPSAHYVLTDNGTHAVFRLDPREVSAQEQAATQGVGSVAESSQG